MYTVSTQNDGNRLIRCLQHDTRVRVDCGFKTSKNSGTFTPALETPYAYSMTFGCGQIAV